MIINTVELPSRSLHATKKWWPSIRRLDPLLVSLVLAIGLYAFDDLALSTILPAISSDLRGDNLYSASFLAFLLTNLASLVAAGYFIDRAGVIRPFVIGMVLFCGGLLLGMAATSMPMFVIGRALQGCGGGTIQAVVNAVIILAWRGPARQRAISWVATSWMIPALIGPLLAGWITEDLHWRYVFVGLFVLAVATFLLALPHLVKIRATGSMPDLDVVPRDTEPVSGGVVLATLGIAVGTGIALAGLDRGGWRGGLAACVGLIVLWSPLRASLPRGFWTASTPLAAVLLLRLLACAVFFGIEAWLPWTAYHTGLASPVIAGLILSASALGWTAATWWVDGAIARISPFRILCWASVLLLLGSTLTWLGVTRFESVPVLFMAWFVAGIAMGLCYPVVATLAMASAEPGREGRLSMMLGLTDTLGITAAIGIGGAWLGAEELGADDRIGVLWVGFIAIAMLLPALLARRRPQFVAAMPNRAGAITE